jgi:hypothetical protein
MDARPLARQAVLTPRRVTILLVLGLGVLQGLVALSAPYWARLLRRPVQADAEDGEASPSPTPSPASATEAARRINVKLLFEAVEGPGLVLEERSVLYEPDLGMQLRRVLEELVRGSETGLGASVDPATRVLEVFVTSGGIAYADLSKELIPPGGTGSAAEEDTVYAIVNTLSVNFPAVTRVQILVEDRPIASLAGHTDLSRPLSPDMTLLAPVELTPLPAAELADPLPAVVPHDP